MPRDANEPNDIPDVLAVIAKASEFASGDQKKELLSDPFVTKVLQTTVDRSAALEAEGKWLDAYTSYFYWLQAIDPNNQGLHGARGGDSGSGRDRRLLPG